MGFLLIYFLWDVGDESVLVMFVGFCLVSVFGLFKLFNGSW